MVSSPSTPSSSAVTIPIPGKSILKPPPPTNPSLLSRITRFLPNSPALPSSSSSSSGYTHPNGIAINTATSTTNTIQNSNGVAVSNGSTISTTNNTNTNNTNNNNNTTTTSPTGGAHARIDSRALKRAHFILPELAIVYPISSLNPPSMPTLKEEKRLIEERERERRKRILRGGRVAGVGSSASASASPVTGIGGAAAGVGVGSMVGAGPGPGTATADDDESYETHWSMDRVESFYKECCAGCDEDPDVAVSTAFKSASSTNPRCVDLSGIELDFVSASILSDVFMIEWGLKKLLLRECDLDEVSLKPILHSLLIPGSLSYLSVASNRRMKAPAFRLIGAYVARAKALQFLDVSQNSLDKKSVEYIVSALTPASEPGLVSLRMDDCQLRPAALETLCRAIRTSSLRNISLRYNRITTSGAVALALMIRDYPDVVPTAVSAHSTTGSSSISSSSFTAGSPPPHSAVSSFSSILTSYTTTSSSSSSAASTPTLPTIPLSPTISPPTPTTSTTHHSPILPPTRTGLILPPPRHPTAAPTAVQTTYTPYVPRSKRNASVATTRLAPLSPTVPLITSSSQGGVTTRHVPPIVTRLGAAGVDPTTTATATTTNNNHDAVAPRHDTGPSAALLDKVRALDALPRLGALRTLDLKGNELRNGMTYIAQVLKRNRTLKVLNLSENKLDVQSLVMIAEALKYNSCLETLDLSRNPCSGPNLEGIQSLRTAFTLNTALKRLFLSGTQMNSAGAIALAEFLPESMSLLHLDLTNNVLDIAGVMALSSGLKANHVMRCLDLNIPENDDEFSRMCREILNTCVRNTEEADNQQNGGPGRGIGKGIWGMIEDSSLARSIRQCENDIVVRARLCVTELDEALTAVSPAHHSQPPPTPTPAVSELADKARSTLAELTSAVQETEDSSRLQALLGMNDRLLGLLAKVPTPGPTLKKPTLTLPGLKGLGVFINGGSGNGPKKEAEAAEVAKAEERFPLIGDGPAPTASRPVLPSEQAVSGSQKPSNMHNKEVEEDTPTTPRIDKGKARAEPEPEEPEKILSPAFLITESEDEDEETRYAVDEVKQAGVSPTDRSRIWVAEEGEVFRKGTVLLGPEELEGEYDSEDLRRELLEAMVERPPPRPITDEYGMEIVPVSPAPEPEPNAPQEPEKPPPKPYISRRASFRSNPTSPSQSPVIPSPSVPLTPILTRPASPS